jgi:hypothetical protein
VAIHNGPAHRLALVRQACRGRLACLEHLVHKQRKGHQGCEQGKEKDKNPEAPNFTPLDSLGWAGMLFAKCLRGAVARLWGSGDCHVIPSIL